MLIVSGGISDEGFSGSRVRDTEDKNRFTKEGAESLINSVREATKKTKTNNAGLNKISAASSVMAKEIAKNTEAVQKVLADDEKSQEQLVKVMEMMADAQEKTGEASVSAIEDLMKEISILKEIGGTDLTNNLGLDEAQKSLASGNGSTISGSLFRKFTNVDEGVTGLDAVKQAFSREKLFGLNPTAKTLEKRADANAKMSLKGSSISELVGHVLGNKQEQVKAVQKNAEGSAAFITGTDRASLGSQQVDLLEQILKQLKIMEDGGGFGMGGIETALTSGLSAAAGAMATTIGGVLLKGIKILGPLLVLKDMYDLISGNDGGTTGENVGGVTGGAVGGLIGFFLGGPAGAAIGMGLGNTIGAAIGNLTDHAMNVDTPSYREMKDLEEYGTVDREEIQKIQMERAGYATPEVIDSDPLTDLSQEDTVKAQTENPVLIQAVQNMPEDQKEAFLQANPHMRPYVQTEGALTPTVEAVREAVSTPTVEAVNYGDESRFNIVPKEIVGQTSAEVDPTPTADAVSNVSDFMGNIMSSITNNIQNITNNNTSGGNTAPSILVSPSGPKNTEFNMIEFMKRTH